MKCRCLSEDRRALFLTLGTGESLYYCARCGRTHRSREGGSKHDLLISLVAGLLMSAILCYLWFM